MSNGSPLMTIFNEQCMSVAGQAFLIDIDVIRWSIKRNGNLRVCNDFAVQM